MKITLTEVVQRKILEEKVRDISGAMKYVNKLRSGNLITLDQWNFQVNGIGAAISKIYVSSPQSQIVIALRDKYHQVFR